MFLISVNIAYITLYLKKKLIEFAIDFGRDLWTIIYWFICFDAYFAKNSSNLNNVSSSDVIKLEIFFTENMSFELLSIHILLI